MTYYDEANNTYIYIYIIFVWEKKKRNEIDDTNGFPFLMLKLYAWCNVENPFTDSLYTDNMFSLIFFYILYYGYSNAQWSLYLDSIQIPVLLLLLRFYPRISLKKHLFVLIGGHSGAF